MFGDRTILQKGERINNVSLFCSLLTLGGETIFTCLEYFSKSSLNHNPLMIPTFFSIACFFYSGNKFQEYIRTVSKSIQYDYFNGIILPRLIQSGTCTLAATIVSGYHIIQG